MRNLMVAAVLACAALTNSATALAAEVHVIRGVVSDDTAAEFAGRLARAADTGEVIGVDVTVQTSNTGDWSFELPRTGELFVTVGHLVMAFPSAEWVTDHIELRGLYRLTDGGRTGLYDNLEAEEVVGQAPAGAVVETLGAR